MNNLNKPRFLISVLLLLIITLAVLFNLEGASNFFRDSQIAISEYLGWFVILIANGFLIFSTYLIFTRYKNLKLGGADAVPSIHLSKLDSNAI